MAQIRICCNVMFVSMPKLEGVSMLLSAISV